MMVAMKMFGETPSRLVASIALLSGLVLSQSPLPTVDLGYEIHRASFFNVCDVAEDIFRMPLTDFS